MSADNICEALWENRRDVGKWVFMQNAWMQTFCLYFFIAKPALKNHKKSTNLSIGKIEKMPDWSWTGQ